MLKKIVINALVIITLSCASSLSYSIDLTVDIDDKDMDRVEGWISEFPEDVRKQMEALLESDALSQTVSQSVKKLTAGMQCVNSQLQHTGGMVLGSTVLSTQEYSDDCIEAIGEEPPGFFSFLGTGQKYGLKQRYHLEKCSLAEFADRNFGRGNFARNVYLEAEMFKTAGYAAFCHNGNQLINADNGKLMFLEATDYENAWADLSKQESPCDSLEACWQYNLGRLSGLVTKYASCGFVEGRDLLAEYDQLKSKVEADGTPESLTWGIYESYNLIRLLSSRQNYWNEKLINTFRRDCATYDAPPKDSQSIIGYNSNAKMLLTQPKQGKAEPEAKYLQMREMGEFCVDPSVQDFFDNHYSKINYVYVETGPCGRGYTTVTDCSSHVERMDTVRSTDFWKQQTVEDECR